MKTFNELLTEKGFTEGVDYSLNGEVLTALPKKRYHTTIVHHEATADRPAYDEEVTTEETYYEVLPTIESLKLEIVLSCDLAYMVNEYLKDKKHLVTEDDSVNFALLFKGGWRFAAVPEPTLDQLYALAPICEQCLQNESRVKQKLELGAKARKACESVLDLVAGYNFSRALTAEQVTEMQTKFAEAEKALKANRPVVAKGLITDIVVDDVLVTQEMKDDCLELLSEY